MWRAFLLLTLVASLSAASAHASITVVPLPEILTDPNEGNTFGFLPVVLLVDPNGRLANIIADDIRYNKITGWFPAFRLLGYPTEDQRYLITLRKSEKIDEDFVGEYEREGVLDGAMDVLVNVTYFAIPDCDSSVSETKPRSQGRRTTRKTSLRPSCASHTAPSKTSRSPGRSG